MKKFIYAGIALTVLLSYSCKESDFLEEGSPGSVQVSGDRLIRIDKMLQQNIDDGYIAGAVGFIARDGKIVYNKAFGVTDPESRSPMMPDHIFRIASQTKAIVSIGLMMLYEEGKFLLDDPVSKYIPEFSHPRVLDTFNEKDTTYMTVPAKREVTIRDLLTHTSGIGYAGIGTPVMNAIYSKGGLRAGPVATAALSEIKVRKFRCYITAPSVTICNYKAVGIS